MKKSKETVNLMIANLAMVIIICAGLLIQYLIVSYQENQQFEQIADTFYAEEDIEPTDEQEELVMPGFAQLQEQNPDMVGWIRIEGTRIDYPVMHTPKVPEYYLKRDFNKDYAASGTPFADYRNNFDPRSTNIIIYGHHMNNGSMFTDLLNYSDESYWQDHQNIVLFTKDGFEQYKIFAAFYSEILNVDQAGFRYYNFINTTDEARFNEFVDNVNRLTPYDTGIDVNLGDELITLSTCSYHVKEGRYVVVGKKIN